MDISTKKLKKKNYTDEHKKLFTAIFQGTIETNADGKLVVGDKLWDKDDPCVDLFVRKSRQLKEEMVKLVEKEVKSLFGK